jgi:hypothetical protein
MSKDLRAIPALIGALFRIVHELSEISERPFTPDGHLVGSIGEVVAADTYDLVLERCSNESFDATTRDGRTVEIKLTGGKKVSVSSEGMPPNILIVLKLDPKNGFSEIYNGEFPREMWSMKKSSKRKVKSLTFSDLKNNPKLLHQVHPLSELNVLFQAAEAPK